MASDAALFYSVMLVVTVVLSISASLALVAFKDKYPIKERNPWLILALVQSYAVVCVLVCLREIMGSSIHCLLFWTLYSIFNTLMFAIIVLRGFLLIVKFNLTQGAKKYHRRLHPTLSSRSEDPSQLSNSHTSHLWFLNNRKYFSNVYLALSIVLPVLLLSSPIMLFFAWHRNARDDGSNSSQCIDYLYVFRFVDLPFGVLMVIAAYEGSKRFQAIQENFFLKEELTHLGLGLVTVGVLISILVVSDALSRDAGVSALDNVFESAYTFVRYILLFFVLVSVSVVEALKIAWDNQKEMERKEQELHQEEEHLIPERPTLEIMKHEMLDMLHDGQGYKVFQSFLENQFAIENILFWRDVTQFQAWAEGKTQAQIERRAWSIFQTYISQDAVLLVNLSYRQFQFLRGAFHASATNLTSETTSGGMSDHELMHQEDLSAVDRSVFDNALAEIVNLMCTDSFRRFRLSSGYRDFVLQQHRNMQSLASTRKGTQVKAVLIEE